MFAKRKKKTGNLIGYLGAESAENPKMRQERFVYFVLVNITDACTSIKQPHVGFCSVEPEISEAIL